jgi:hypothetical protein
MRLSQRRRGVLTGVFLIGFGVFLVAVALAVEAGNLWSARQELQITADAASLAGVQALADDRLLTEPGSVMAQVVANARAAALRVGIQNPVAGRPHVFDANEGNASTGDIVFGFIDDPESRAFSPAPPSQTGDPLLNALLVRALRTAQRGRPVPLYFGALTGQPGADLGAEALAYLDRDVIGFRPQLNVPLPLLPLALLSDPALKQPPSWEAQVAQSTSSTGSPGNQGRLTFRLPLQNANAADAMAAEPPSAALLTFRQPEARAHQVLAGVRREHLLDFGGQFVLDGDDALRVPGELFAPPRNNPSLHRLLQALEQLALRDQRRVWPLYQTVQPGGADAPPGVVVSGFVAARLLRARISRLPYQHLELTLRPCQLVTQSAVTDAARRRADGLGPAPNRYIAKARLLR